MGLALSNAPQCYAAFTGCLLCVLVVLIALTSLASHEIKRKALMKEANMEPVKVAYPKVEDEKDTKPRVSARSDLFRLEL